MSNEFRKQYDPSEAHKRLRRDVATTVNAMAGRAYDPHRSHSRPHPYQVWLAKPLPIGDRLLLYGYSIAWLTLVGVTAATAFN